MKSLPLFLALAAVPLLGADAALPEFNSKINERPPLSLSESAKQAPKPHSFSGTVPTLDELTRDGFPGADKRPTIPRKPTPPRFAPKSAPGSMPIIEPNPDIDYKIVLKTPDPSVDFKMLIKPSGADQAPAK
jgi:hypothetical protein